MTSARTSTYEVRVLQYLRHTSQAPREGAASSPQRIKVSVVASELHMSKKKAIDAMNSLEQRGLIIVSDRDPRGTRTVAVVPGACLCQ